MLSIRQFRQLNWEMHKFFRFLYLNTYSFFLLFCGIITVLIPLFKVSKPLIIPQVLIALLFIKQAAQLFSTWKDKKIKYEILIGKNKNGFRPDSFKIFMQAPCGRLLAKAVLKDLGLKQEYKNLLVYREPLSVSIKNGCISQETKIYINEDFK